MISKKCDTLKIIISNIWTMCTRKASTLSFVHCTVEKRKDDNLEDIISLTVVIVHQDVQMNLLLDFSINRLLPVLFYSQH
ncbi:hypothetical protein DERP_011543 [Dermatophagoides pteronyssinus]|uniref:Uncharacterized protein n=1 Tax=Dermatophagoides pteronyssinus TaxID=6956 RepID=A0ABQ8JCC2_DERPT|nr:hypothetical protein DERP_011543 [Dermatophagoides pteronyssinus]